MCVLPELQRQLVNLFVRPTDALPLITKHAKVNRVPLSSTDTIEFPSDATKLHMFALVTKNTYIVSDQKYLVGTYRYL